jgi:hypothetical protein
MDIIYYYGLIPEPLIFDSCFFLARTCISIMIGQWILNLLCGIKKKGGIWRYQKGNQNPLFEEQIIQDWAIMNATKKTTQVFRKGKPFMFL